MDQQEEHRYFTKIINKIKNDRNIDFSQYREKILERRIMYRVRVTKNQNFREYYTHLEKERDELHNLVDAITINVTEFFRDSYVFDAIEKRVLPDLFLKKRILNDNTINIWSCGCSTGQEAYSTLILIAEHLGSKLAKYKLKIFGTDIDMNVIRKAEQGIFDISSLKNLSEKRKKAFMRYFYNVEELCYWIQEEWPSFIEFRYHDIIADIPLANIDMILCRNLLIYFEKKLQEQVIDSFYSSLNNGGFLVLGNVESILNNKKNNFIEYDRRSKIYVKRKEE